SQINFAHGLDKNVQIPTSKFQRSNKAPSSKTDLRALCSGLGFGVWGFRFGTSLELGVWCLVFRLALGEYGPTASVPKMSEVVSTRVPLPRSLLLSLALTSAHRRLAPCPVFGVPWPFALLSGRGRTPRPSR